MAYTIDQLVEKYLELRRRTETLKADYNTAKAPFETAMAQLEGVFLQHMTTHGMDSFSTAAGTPYRTIRTSVSVQDWEAFFGWAKDNEQEGMLTRGANKTAVEEYAKAHQELPPGLKVSRDYLINVRKAGEK